MAAPSLLWHHIGMTAYAAFLKLTLGTDDLVWLAPFVARESTRAGKLRVTMLYSASVTVLVALAAVIGALFNEAGDKLKSLKFWTKIAAGGLLLFYSLKLGGWLVRCGLKGDESDSDEEGAAAPSGDGGVEAGLLEKARCDRSPASASSSSQKNIVWVALAGSLDDFTVYMILATSGVFCWYELLVGTFAGCLVLALVVALFTESKAISAVLTKIPVWIVLAVLAAYILISALLDH